MFYITIDGDDIGQKIASCYLSNNPDLLININKEVQEAVRRISIFLSEENFDILFCAADGVAGCSSLPDINGARLYKGICDLSGLNLTFSVGTGATLRESYIALLYAKSSGKARICDYKEMLQNV